jgi:uncharacterized membrane-anchored protein
MRSALALTIAVLLAAPTHPVPLGRVATLDALEGARVSPCGASELELQRRALRDMRLLFCGVLQEPSGLRVRYDFVRTGRVDAPGAGALRSDALTQALADREAMRPGTRFVGWRRRPTWASERYALLWAYDVRVQGRPSTLSYAAVCTREGVLLLTRLDARPQGFDQDELSFVGLLARIRVETGRRNVDATLGDTRAPFRAADLIANRGRAPNP